MSWFNINNSLNNIKDQISSLASEVLSDGTATDADSNSNLTIQQLQEIIVRKEAEIELLRSANDTLTEKVHHSSRLVKENEAGNDDGWSWDPPNPTENTTKTLSELKKKIDILEIEKKDLIVSLEQLDLDCQQTTDKLVTIKDELQTELNKLKLDSEDLKKKNQFLKKINEENQKKITTLELHAKPNEQVTNILIKNRDLEEKLLHLKNECESFKNVELKSLKKKFNKLKEIISKYKEFKDVHVESIEAGDYTNFEHILQEYECKVINYEQELSSLKLSNSELHTNLTTNQQEIQIIKASNNQFLEHNQTLKAEIKSQVIIIESLKQQHNTNSEIIMQLRNELNRVSSENDVMHKKYIEILQESISKTTDIQFPQTFNDNKSEYANIVETIVELILDYKWKCESLDKEVTNLTEEKTKILSEKNHEIEKLIKNSEELSIEIIMKSQDLKHYEEECAEVIKNNELLITRLDEVKSSSSLQTISETNEESMLHLEQQLDKSNKRVEELEFELAEIDIENCTRPEESKTELDYVKEQLNITGKELDISKKKYQDLASSYLILENDNDSLKCNLKYMKVNFDECFSEKEDLNVTVDQMKFECENTEYKYAEQNINMETLKEEVETHLQTIESLTYENKKLEIIRLDIEGKNELMGKEIEDLKQELTAALDLVEQKNISLEEFEQLLKQSEETENVLKRQIEELLKKNQTILELKESAEANCNRFSSDVSSYHNKIAELSKGYESLLEQNGQSLKENHLLKEEILRLKECLLILQEKHQSSENLQETIAEKNKLLDEIKLLNDTLLEKNNELVILETLREGYESLKVTFDDISQEKNRILNDFENFKASVAENNCPNDDAQIVELTSSRNQLIQLIQEKHQENINYHAEIQRLQQLLSLESEKSRTFEAQLQNLNAISISAEEIAKKDEEIDKLSDQNNFLREKCSKLAENLMQEQSNIQKIMLERSDTSEREVSLQKKLDGLRQHLIDVEDSYTKEVQVAELRCDGMQMKLHEVEQREKNSSNRYTSVNIRANQQVETLQTQLQLVTNQRDDLKNKLSDYEDEMNKQKAALTNLHSAFQQFQREKDKEIQIEAERIGRQVTQEKLIQGNLDKEIGDLKVQLEESKQGLKAAVRLSDQVEASKRQVSTMKDEVAKLQQQLAKSEEKYNKYMNQSDGKVDKMLIKNLIIGLISTNNNLTKDQNQILKIISTVLDFNQQDIEKVKLNKNQQNSWLNSLMHPGVHLTQDSLSLAFVKFLEAESNPRELPNLLDSASAMPNEPKPSESSRSSSVRQSPILLNEIVLPTFADFGQNRNSSSILKDVLKDNSNS